MPSRAVIAGYVRSPFTPARKGRLAGVRPDDLAAQVVRALVERTGVAPADIEDIIMGCAFPEGEQGMNVARLVGLLADLPLSVAGMTVNRFCGSSMQAVHVAAGAVAVGAGHAFVCAGVEGMSRVPINGFNPRFNPALPAKQPGAYMSMGDTAEIVARRWDVSRAQQDAFAAESHRKAAAAQAEGRLDAEIVAVDDGAGGVVARDGCIRAETSVAALAGLRPVFDQNGSVTAGTSSPLTDGCAAVLVTSEAYAERRGLDPLAVVRSQAVAGCGPEIMGVGPVEATRKALARAGLDIGAIDIVELNEAFASQALASVRDIGIRADALNLDGGALALGHPLGATGARLVGKAASLLRRTGARYALVTQCIGGGQGIATVLERA